MPLAIRSLRWAVWPPCAMQQARACPAFDLEPIVSAVEQLRPNGALPDIPCQLPKHPSSAADIMWFAMPVYWSSNSVPDLAALPPARRKAIWNECRKTGSIRFAFVTAGAQVTIMFGSFLLYLITPHRLGSWLIPIQVVGALLVPLATNHFRIRSVLPEIRRRIGGLSCQCGYDLRAKPQRCPECGAVAVNAGKTIS